MTIKLPEPVIKKSTMLSHPDSPLFGALYTEAQLKQALRDVLEQAAQICEHNQKAAEKILQMIGEIK